jgi:hypothetical protein
MKELTTEEMSSLRGGQPFNIAALISVNNAAAAVPIAVNGSGNQNANQNAATALAGNQTDTTITQSN